MKVYLLGLMIGVCSLGIHANAATMTSKQSAKDITYCEDVVRMHAMLSSAQFTCQFSGYSEDLFVNAAQCMKKMNDKRSDALIKEGIELFNYRLEQDGNQKETCKSALETFPNILQK